MLTALALVSSVIVHATPAPATRAPLDVDVASKQLIEAKEFEDVSVGIDGHLSGGVRAYRVVFAAPDAAQRFKAVAARGGLPGKLYAAIGLREKDPAAFRELLEELAPMGATRVHIRAGCLSDHPKVTEVIESTRDDAVRLEPGQTMKSWMALHPKGRTIDIIGGGYGAMFADPSKS